MNKLFTLKKWFTLKDSAKWLSSLLEEDVTVNDILQLALDRELPLSWLVNNRRVRKAEPITSIFYNEEDTKKFEDTKIAPEPFHTLAKSLPENHTYKIFYSHPFLPKISVTSYTHSFEASGPIFHVSGIFKLHQDTGGIDESIADWLTNEDNGWGSFNGFIIEDDEKELYQPTDVLPLTEEDKAKGKTSIYQDSAYPSDKTPTIDEMVISRSDLEAFKSKLIPNDTTEPTLRTNEQSLIESLGIMAILLTEKSGRFNRNNIPNAKQITKAIEQKCADLGITIEQTSNLNRDIAAAFKQLKGKEK
jgi:hypothetical protein